jgi:uncharacterized protein (DUF488 family)
MIRYVGYRNASSLDWHFNTAASYRMEMKIMMVYTIGHSNHMTDEFIDLLKKFEINCLCDIRSVPYSKYAGQFNRENIKTELKRYNIKYLYFGEEFGARRTEEELLKDGAVDFEKVAGDAKFLSGIERIKKGIEMGYIIAIMCAEKNPVDCHRSILVSRNLEKYGISVKHILADGSLECHKQTEENLIDRYFPYRNQISLQDFIEGGTDCLEEAYRRANKEIGYRGQDE